MPVPNTLTPHQITHLNSMLDGLIRTRVGLNIPSQLREGEDGTQMLGGISELRLRIGRFDNEAFQFYHVLAKYWTENAPITADAYAKPIAPTIDDLL